MINIEEIEKLRGQLDDMIELGKFSKEEILRISKELDNLIHDYEGSSNKYVS